ncbi:putative 7-carboxy-7-deazaguanine synthase QueE [Clostridium paridis]|uniref:7-carboxy-7-deazaguanine synthase n=1 Tax=Clostridium paridis TaxID=2803863 RepID=A0A937FC84_9CLOT|nr:putative 7-carboxy-7-deazaguanine synthase QueE [Clostridium paridis]MBL4931239.1 putative 7-carboxy-7-deazaguanine synthase QueE [Clostridium paridis]
MLYNVIEKFLSIDGEGPTAGELATFIRFGGCNLACSWCDTAYSIPKSVKGEPLTKEDIYKYIKDNGTKNVTLTGGEPLIQEGIEELIDFLSKDKELLIHIETNGSIPVYKYEKIDNVIFILDYKLPSSNMEQKMDTKNYENLRDIDVCKFVIESMEDLQKAKEVIEKYKLSEKCLVYFSPITTKIKPVEIVEFMKVNKMNNIRLQIQLHKIIWSPETRGV